MKFISSMAAAAVFFAIGSAANAASTVDTFDTLDPGWYVDRYAPATFTTTSFMGDSRLEIGIVSGDQQSDPFRNTQGKKINHTPGTIFTSIDLFVTSDMLAYTGRVTGFWGTGLDATSTISSYPILELANGTFHGWDSLAPGGFTDYGLPAEITGDQWVNLAMLIDTVSDTIKYFIDGEFVGSVGAYGTKSITNTIIQAYNHEGVDRSFFYDNLTAADTSPIPLPAAAPLLGSALLGFAGVSSLRRRFRKAA